MTRLLDHTTDNTAECHIHVRVCVVVCLEWRLAKHMESCLTVSAGLPCRNCVYLTSYSCIIQGNKLCIFHKLVMYNTSKQIVYRGYVWRMDHSRPVAGGGEP